MKKEEQPHPYKDKITKEHIVLNFLKSHPKKRFVVRQLQREINGGSNLISYPTVCKWVNILIARGKVKVDDYGIVKVVWYDEN